MQTAIRITVKSGKISVGLSSLIGNTGLGPVQPPGLPKAAPGNGFWCQNGANPPPEEGMDVAPPTPRKGGTARHRAAARPRCAET